MDVRVWTEDLSVGNGLLDQHHQRLFALLGEVSRVVETNGTLAAVAGLVAELNTYVAYHFAEEEAMMDKAGFPFLDLHRHSHQTIAMRVDDFAQALTEATHLTVARELCTFLSGWLFHHIEIEDFEYRPYVGGAVHEG